MSIRAVLAFILVFSVGVITAIAVPTINDIIADVRRHPRVDQSRIVRIAGILRPDRSGQWYVQRDANHVPVGLDSMVLHGADHIRVFFTERTYEKAISLQISSDADFAQSIVAHADLGLSGATIYFRAYPNVKGTDKPIDPGKVWEYLPWKDAGNIWFEATMLAVPD